MMKRCHIYGKKNIEGPEGWENDDHAPWYDPAGKLGPEISGAIINGYTEAEMLAYFDKIEGFARYAFNKSHSACYAYIGFLTAWLKYYYPTEYMAAVLTMQGDAKGVAHYVDICENKMHIKVKTPDINVSGRDFTPDGKNILYGLGSIKSVGEAAVKEILAHQPYADLEDAISRIPKKAFNKRIGENIIKAGGFDWLHENRLESLNEFHHIRKDKVEDIDPVLYAEERVMDMEEESLGAPITYKPWWNTVKEGKKIVVRGHIRNINERKDRRGRLMAFPEMVINNCVIEGLIFASSYARCAIEVNEKYMQQYDYEFEFTGKKDEKGKFMLDSIKAVWIEQDDTEAMFAGTEDVA